MVSSQFFNFVIFVNGFCGSCFRDPRGVVVTLFDFSNIIVSMSHIPVYICIISLGVDGGVWSIIWSVLFSIFVSVPLRPLFVSMFLLRAVVWVWCMFLLVSIWFSFLFG